MTVCHSEKSTKDKENLRTQLYKRDGTKCHYCGIEEKEFTNYGKKVFMAWVREVGD